MPAWDWPFGSEGSVEAVLLCCGLAGGKGIWSGAGMQESGYGG